MALPLVMILACLIMAYVCSALLSKLGAPRVVGQIVAGLILGIGALRPIFFGAVNLTVLSFLANLGIILLFYYVGLQTSFSKVTKHVKRSVLISAFNTVVPLGIGFVVMRYALQYDVVTSIVVGAGLAVSAQAVAVDMLEELKLIKSRIGTLLVSAGAVDDVVELVLVSVILSVVHFATTTGGPVRQLFDLLVFIVFILVARLWLIHAAFKFFHQEESSTSRFMGSLIILLIIVSLSEVLGAGALIGAMAAGILVRQTVFKERDIPDWEEHDIARSIHIIAFGFLIPLFFVWIGVTTDLARVWKNMGFIALLTVIATVGTVGGTALATLIYKGNWREGWLLGWGLNAKGDVELVIAALALTSGVITQTIFSSLVIMSLITTLISPMVFKYLVVTYKKHGRLP